MQDDSTEDLAWALTDILSAVMFLFIIFLVLFAYMFRANYEDAPAQGAHVSDAVVRRTLALSHLSDALSRHGFKHEVDAEKSEIILQPKDFSFAPGDIQLEPGAKNNLSRLASAIDKGVRCFTANPTPSLRCPEGVSGSVTGLAVVGHSDNVPVRASEKALDNLDLSGRRAAYLIRMLELEESIRAFSGPAKSLTIFAVAMGDRQPLVAHVRPTDEMANRRIALRLQFAAPWIAF